MRRLIWAVQSNGTDDGHESHESAERHEGDEKNGAKRCTSLKAFYGLQSSTIYSDIYTAFGNAGYWLVAG